MFSVSDIKALGRKVVERNQAESILKQGRQVLSGHSKTLQTATLMRLQHDLDIDIAKALINKRVTKEDLEAGRCFVSKCGFDAATC